MATLKLYNETTQTWEAIPNIVGPRGPQGPEGPQGPKGEPGFYQGSGEPTDGSHIWIDQNEEPDTDDVIYRDDLDNESIYFGEDGKIHAAGGAAGGTSNYNLLSNLPSINGVTLKGDVSLPTFDYFEEHKDEFKGDQGDVGPKGDKGDKGDQGPQGEPGADGPTAAEVRSMVSEEVAKVVADAPESLDTLKEIADWIDEHEDSASAMNTAIGTNKTNIETLQGTVGTHGTDIAQLKTDGASVATALDHNGYGEQSGGKNLLNIHNGTSEVGASGGYWARGVPISLKAGTYTFSCKSNGSTSGQFTLDLQKNGTRVNEYVMYHRPQTTYTFTIASDVDSINGYSNTACTFTELQIEQGNSATSYEPYFSSNKMLTEDANEMASLKFLGWTVPRGYSGPRNYVDGDGKFHQRVGRDLAEQLNWGYDSVNSVFYAYISSTMKSGANVYLNGYTTHYVGLTDMGNMEIRGQNNSNIVYVKNTAYTDVNAFKATLSGKGIYYELATEVVFTEGGEKLNDLIIIRSYQSDPISLNANGVKDTNFQLEQIPGYKPIAVIGYKNNMSNYIFVSQSALGVTEENTGFGAWVCNMATSNYNNVVITAYVMYVRK